MITGTDGSLGKRKEFAARGEMGIWNIKMMAVSVKGALAASTDPRWPLLKKSKWNHSHGTNQRVQAGNRERGVTTEKQASPSCKF